MLEMDKLKKKQKEGLIVTTIGIVFFIVGLFAYSITESHTSDVIGVPITLVSRPYGAIGAFLMLLGIVEIIVGIISKKHYDNKLRIYEMQFSKQYPPGQYYQQLYPQQQYQQNYHPPPQQTHQPTSSKAKAYCHKCGKQIPEVSGFCIECVTPQN
jgi:hypothetical protein